MMNVLRDGRSERGTARLWQRHDLKTVRWYVLTLPYYGCGTTRQDQPRQSLDAELPAQASWGDVVRVFRPLLCGGEEGGRKDGQHEAAPAVQLRVCPVLG